MLAPGAPGRCAGRSDFAESPTLRAGERGREVVGTRGNILKSEMVGGGRRKRFGGPAGNGSERKGGKAGNCLSFL